MVLPPGPQSSALHQTVQIITRPLSFLDRCANQFGDTFTLRVLGPQSPPVVFFADPDSIQQIFNLGSPQLELGQAAHIFRPLTGDTSLILLNGAEHRRQRQLLMPPLHGERLHCHGAAIQLLAEVEVDSWQRGEIRSMHEAMLSISLQIIVKIVFGVTSGQRYVQLSRRIESLLKVVTDPLFSTQFFFPLLQQDMGRFSPWGRFLRLQRQVDHLIYAEIRQRRHHRGLDRSDILSLLLEAKDDRGEGLSPKELRDQLITLLLLGHETTASALAWAFHWIHRHPYVHKRLLKEIDSMGCDDPMQIAQLPYLTAVCQESLRIQPIALIAQPRIATQNLQIGSFELQAGTFLVPCIYLAHRRPQTYLDPEQFRPDRFLTQTYSAYEFFPFGGGNRTCIGMALALFEMKLILATVLSRSELAPASGDDIFAIRRGITFVPCDRARLKIRGKRTGSPEATAAIHQQGR